MRTRFLLTLITVATATPAVFAQGGFDGPGRYEITNVKSGKVIDLDRNNRTTVIQFSARNTENQYWDIENASSGYFRLRNAMFSDKVLDAMGDRNSTRVQGMPSSSSDTQLWKIDRAKNGEALIVNRRGKTLDIPDGSDRDGLPVQIYDLNGDSNQRFTLRRVAGGGLGDRFRPGRDRRESDDRYRNRRGPAGNSGYFDDHDRMWKVRGDGACFYPQTGYRGRAFCSEVGNQVDRIGGEWNGQFSSVKFFGRTRTVEIFDQEDFRGRNYRLTDDEPDLRDARPNLRVGSFRID